MFLHEHDEGFVSNKRQNCRGSLLWDDLVAEANKIDAESVMFQLDCMWLDSGASDGLFGKMLLAM